MHWYLKKSTSKKAATVTEIVKERKSKQYFYQKMGRLKILAGANNYEVSCITAMCQHVKLLRTFYG